MLIEM